MKPTPGQKAYEAYCAFRKGKSFEGRAGDSIRELPSWLELSDHIREAWEQAAYAAINEWRLKVTIRDKRHATARDTAREFDEWYLEQGKKYYAP